MKFLLLIAFIVIICVPLLVLGFGWVKTLSSPSTRAARRGNNPDNPDLTDLREDLRLRLTEEKLDHARMALIKIAANDSGNPSLDAKIALESAPYKLEK